MKKTAVLLIFIFVARIGAAQDLTKGLWFNAEKSSKLQFFKQGDKIFAKIVWMKEPVRDGKNRVDDKNPDAKLKNRALMGMNIITNLVKEEGSVWNDGQIYDPNNGKTYSCKVTWLNDKELDLRGYIGFSLLGRTTKFSRAE